MSNSREYTTNFIKTHQAMGVDFKKLYSNSKYKAKKVNYDGIVFDSKAECNRYIELKTLEKYGKIKDLQYHKCFELLPSIKTEVETLRAIIYESDFFYYDVDLNSYVVEDLKSEMTRKLSDYIIKKKLMINAYRNYIFFENSYKSKKYYKIKE